MGPLTGIRVADFTIAAVGPWASMLLATLGADVVKVEPPLGDIARAVPPTQGGVATVWMACNLGKRSICLDLKRPNHLQAALKLIAKADVVIENMRPGTTTRLGIGYEQVSRLNERLVYCSASGYGQKGPWSDVGGSDALMQAFAGWVSLTGEHGGRGELLRYVAHADLTTSSYIVSAILLALNARQATGRGQKVDMSMLEACLDLETTQFADFLVTGEAQLLSGSADRRTAPHRAFAAQDNQYVCVGVTDDSTWARFCEAVGRPELTRDLRLATNELRVRHRTELDAILAPLFVQRSAGDWVDQLRANGIAAGTMWTREQLMADDHVRENGHICKIASPVGPLDVSGVPWTFSDAETPLNPPSRPGEHTAEVMRELGHELDQFVPDIGHVVSTF